MLFIAGVQLFGMGLLGEYIGRIFEEIKARPVYIVECAVNIKAQPIR
jgi:dolichol-phosphate mannosyltransferase